MGKGVEFVGKVSEAPYLLKFQVYPRPLDFGFRWEPYSNLWIKKSIKREDPPWETKSPRYFLR